MKRKITNLVKEMHHQVAKSLTKKYKCILLPDFRTKQITERSDNSTLNRSAYYLSFFKFKQFMIHKAELNGSKVILCKESWTSKTCSNCGNIHQSLGSKKTYECSACGITIDRDVNGARNIYIRSLTKYFENN